MQILKQIQANPEGIPTILCPKMCSKFSEFSCITANKMQVMCFSFYASIVTEVCFIAL